MQRWSIDAYICRYAEGSGAEEHPMHWLFPPVGFFSIKLLDQALEEELHGIIVVVRLQQAQVDGTHAIQAHYHGDPWDHLQLDHWSWLVLKHPLHSSEVSHANPALVNIDYALALIQQIHQGYCIPLPQYQVLGRISMNCHRFHLLVAHVHVFSEDLSNLMLLVSPL